MASTLNHKIKQGIKSLLWQNREIHVVININIQRYALTQSRREQHRDE